MNDMVFKLYMKVTDLLKSDREKEVFKMGFALGKSEGIAYCTKKLSIMNKVNKK